MNKIIKILLIIMLLASSASAKSALDLGIAGVGARPMGMGRSFVAIANDVNAIFMNPAGLAFQKSWGITSMSTKLLNRVNYKMMGGIYPTEHGTFGLGYISLTTTAGYLTTDLASLASATPISYGSTMIILSYAYDLNQQIKGNPPGRMAFGGNLKFINSKFEGIDNASGSGMEADLGVIFKPQDNLTLGANLQNTLLSSDGGKVSWSSDTTEDVPSVLKLGVAYQVIPELLLSLDSDFDMSDNQPALLHAGIEWALNPIITLRTGVDQDIASSYNLTAGTSVKISGVSFEYAYRQDGTQGELSNHYFSISFSPPAKRKLVASKVREEILKEKEQNPRRERSKLSYSQLMAELYGEDE